MTKKKDKNEIVQVVPEVIDSPKRLIPTRHKMPIERSGPTHKFRIGDEEEGKGYVTANMWDDGVVGEIFIRMNKQGSTVSGFVDAWAISVSMLLQVGVPLRTITDKFKGQRFQPNGFTGNPDIPIATSPIDYIARWLELRFLTPLSEESE